MNKVIQCALISGIVSFITVVACETVLKKKIKNEDELALYRTFNDYELRHPNDEGGKRPKGRARRSRAIIRRKSALSDPL